MCVENLAIEAVKTVKAYATIDLTLWWKIKQ